MSSEPQTLDEIRDWHRDIVDALLERRASLQKAIRLGLKVAAQFMGMTEAEIDSHYDATRSELDRLVMLNLVACGEAEFRSDYFRRVEKKLKDPLSLAYRKWHSSLSRKKKRRPDFDEGGLLDVLKTTKLVSGHIIGQFRECLLARHWVGHGRYWSKPSAVDRLDPDDVTVRVRALLNACYAL